MRRRVHPVSRIERVASVATAIGVTVATALLVLAIPVRRRMMPPVPAPAHDVERTVQHVVFVAPPPPTPVVPSPRRAARSSAPARSGTVNASASLAPTSGPPPDSASLTGEATVPLATGASPSRDTATAAGTDITTPKISPPVSTAGAPAASARVGFIHGRVEGLAPPPFKPLPPTQAERDAKWRDEAFEIAAARGAGEPVRVKMAGGSVPVPLPFGGPSRKERERDRAIEEQLKVMRATRQQRIDSVVAARKRRLADSLARVTDSLGRRPRSPL